MIFSHPTRLAAQHRRRVACGTDGDAQLRERTAHVRGARALVGRVAKHPRRGGRQTMLGIGAAVLGSFALRRRGTHGADGDADLGEGAAYFATRARRSILHAALHRRREAVLRVGAAIFSSAARGGVGLRRGVGEGSARPPARITVVPHRTAPIRCPGVDVQRLSAAFRGAVEPIGVPLIGGLSVEDEGAPRAAVADARGDHPTVRRAARRANSRGVELSDEVFPILYHTILLRKHSCPKLCLELVSRSMVN